MHLLASPRAGPDLLQSWRQQVGGQLRRRAARGPRELAALSFLPRGVQYEGMIDVRRLLLVVVHDERRWDQSPAIRVAGYMAVAVPWGVKFGGAEQNRFEKDLTRPTTHEAIGRRMDLAAAEILTTALLLDRQLERHAGYPHLPRPFRPRWPQLFAALEPEVAHYLVGAGPEFEASGQPLLASQRGIAGLVAFPLEFVSHAWERFTTVFADLTTIPKRQVITLDHAERNLCGQQGALEFDLHDSRFTPHYGAPRRRHAGKRSLTAVG